MGVLDIVSGLANAAGQGFGGYSTDQQLGVKKALEDAKAAQEAERNRVLNLLTQKEIARQSPGDAGYGAYKADEIKTTAPAETTAKVNDINATAQPMAHAAALKDFAENAPLVARAGETAMAGVPAHNAETLFSSQHPAPAFKDFQDVDPATNQPRTRILDTHTGGITTEGGGKAGGAGAQNAPQMAAAKANFETAIKTMDDYEAKLARGEATYGPFDAAKGAVGSSEQAQTAKGLLGPVESFVSNAAGSSLRGDNPDLAEYLKAKKFLAEAALNTHKRPNQTQYEIEQELSGIGPMSDFTSADAKKQIAQSAERRANFGRDVFGIGAPSVMPSGGGATSGGKTVVVNGKTFHLPP